MPANLIFAPTVINPVDVKNVVPDLTEISGPTWPFCATVVESLAPNVASKFTVKVDEFSAVILIVSLFWKLPVLFLMCK